MLTAREVQALLGVADDVVIAHGYTTDQHAVVIYFHAGELVRQDAITWRSADFLYSFFTANIKRFYQNGVHPQLVALFDTFSAYGLALTPGGADWGQPVFQMDGRSTYV